MKTLKKIFLCGFLFLAGICFYTYKNPGTAITVFAFFCILAAAAFQDIEKQKIGNCYAIAVSILAVIALFTMPEISIGARLSGAMCVSIPMLLLAIWIPGAFGGGDIKLMAAGGLFMGWKTTLISTGIAISVGAVYGLYLLAVKRAGRKLAFAFGPFLSVGMMVGMLYSEAIIKFMESL